MALKIISRAEWNARQPKNRQKVSPKTRKGVRIHYSGANKKQTVRSIQDYCMDKRGFADIDYNFLVDYLGNVYEGRGWDVVGSHTIGYNVADYGICAIGTNGDITEVQMSAIRELYDMACVRSGKILIQRVHSDNAKTSCPGARLRHWVHVQKMKDPLSKPNPPKPKPSAPKYPGVLKRNQGFVAAVQTWQKQMQKRGWRLGVDGIFGPETERVVRSFQAEKKIPVTGTINQKTWDGAWLLPVTKG